MSSIIYLSLYDFLALVDGAFFVGHNRWMVFYCDSSQVAQVSPSIYAYHFIIDETIEAKRLINTLYQMVNRFMPGSFRCNQPMAIIISKSMKRYLDNLEIPLYYNDIFISQL